MESVKQVDATGYQALETVARARYAARRHAERPGTEKVLPGWADKVEFLVWFINVINPSTVLGELLDHTLSSR